MLIQTYYKYISNYLSSNIPLTNIQSAVNALLAFWQRVNISFNSEKHHSKKFNLFLILVCFSKEMSENG